MAGILSPFSNTAVPLAGHRDQGLPSPDYILHLTLGTFEL